VPLGTKVGLDPGYIVLHGDPAHAPKRAQPPNFGRRLLWPNGRPSQLLLSTFSVHRLFDAMGRLLENFATQRGMS